MRLLWVSCVQLWVSVQSDGRCVPCLWCGADLTVLVVCMGRSSNSVGTESRSAISMVAFAGSLAVVAALLAVLAPVRVDARPPLSHVFADTAFLVDELSSLYDDKNADLKSGVEKYLTLVLRSAGLSDFVDDGDDEETLLALAEQPSRPKRELFSDSLMTITRDPKGVFLLEKLSPRFSVPAKFPDDVLLFQRHEFGEVQLYAAALEADQAKPELSPANWMVLYRLTGDRFVEQSRVPVLGGATLGVQEMAGWTYLVAAEREGERRAAPEAGSILYRLSEPQRSGPGLARAVTLTYVQTLFTVNPTDLCFWEFMGSHYMAVTTAFNTSSGAMTHAADSLVYKWLGEHLDIVQRLPTHGARAVTAFQIDSNQYVMVVNHINDLGETNIDSTIYRYDVVQGRLVVHQHLRTHGGVDASFFSMERPRGRDHFLVVANLYYKGPDGDRNFLTNSVIYKWTEGYFVPFQSTRLFGASKWTPYSGPRGEFVLLGASGFGLHTYQYDGWRFQEVDIAHPFKAAGIAISSLRSFTYGAEGLVVMGSKQNPGVEANVFALRFDRSNRLDNLYAQMGLWCAGQSAELRRNSGLELRQRVLDAPKRNTPVVTVETITFEPKTTIEVLSASSIKSNSTVIDGSYVREINGLVADLQQTQREIALARERIDSALKKDGVNHVRGRLVLHDAGIQCPGGCVFASAEVGTLNNVDVRSFVANAVRLDADINITTAGALQFTNVVVPGNLATRRVLGVDAPLVSRVDTTELLGALVVDTLEVNSELVVDGTVDNVRINPDTVLLVDGDQSLDGYVYTSSWQVDRLVLHGRLNGMTLDVSQPELPPEVLHTWLTSTPPSLVVKDVTLTGLLGDVDLGDVARRALRTSGHQVVTGAHSFSELAVREVDAHLLSGVRIEDVIRTDQSVIKIPGSVRFSNPLAAGSVKVFKRLNHVGVAVDGSLDLLLSSGKAGAQNVTGAKWVRGLRVTEHARIHGHILGLELPAEDETLLRVIEDDIIVEGDVEISGEVFVDGLLSAHDVAEPTSGLTVLHVIEHGVRIDEQIPANVVLEQVDVTNVDVEVVNDVRVSSWIQDRPGQKVQLSHTATFSGDLHVASKSTLLGTVNNVNLVTLDQTSLKTTGDQRIEGLKTFHTVTAHDVKSGDIVVGGASWKDVWVHHTRNHSGSGVVKLKDNVIVDGELLVKRLRVDGNLGGVDVTTILEDSVFSDSRTVVIDGPKTFRQTVRVSNIKVGDGVSGTDLSGVLAGCDPDADEKFFDIPQGVTITSPMSVAHLNYHGTLDGVSDEDWSAPWLEVDGDQTLYGPQVIQGNVDAVAGLSVGLGVNGFDVAKFAEEVARIDDPNLRLGQVTFDGPVISKGPVSAGRVGGVDLADALLSVGSPNGYQEVSGAAILSGGLEVMGHLGTAGMLAGENFTELCAFAYLSPSSLSNPQHITVEGDLLLDEEMMIYGMINGNGMAKLLNNTWLRDKPALIRTDLQFADVTFHSDVSVEGRIDGVDLDAIASRYVSLSGDSTILTSLLVTDGIVVEGSLISGGPVDVEGLVSGLPLRDLPNKVLMDGPDQDVAAPMTFDTVHTAGDLTLNGTVNGLDLLRDVVRTDWDLKRNVVMERKQVQGAHITDLGADIGVRVQGVDLAAWNSGAVRVRGSYVVEGPKDFVEPKVTSNMIVEGTVNGVKVDANHLLLKHSDQVVVGPKTMQPSPMQGLGLRVNSLEVHGRVNGVNMRELLANQAYRTGDVEVLTPVNLTVPLHSTAVVLEGLYDGVNVSELIWAAEHPPFLNQYDAEHKSLLDVAHQAQQSLRAQGYYLNYYHTAASLRSSVRAVLPLGSPGRELAVAVIQENAVELAVRFYAWDAASGVLVAHPSLKEVSLPLSVSIIDAGSWVNQHAIYWEADESSTPGVGLHLGFVMGLLRDGRLGVAQVLRDPLASGWVAVTDVGSQSCLIRGHPGGAAGMDGFCSMHCLRGEDLQQLPLPVLRPMHATSLSVNGVPYVFVASGASERTDGAVSVWRWDDHSGAAGLTLAQELLVVNATALAAVEYRGVHYLATASGQVQDAPHDGLVHISRFDGSHGNWSHWLSVEVAGPHRLQFAVLPSGELALYVTTTCPSDNLVVFLYRGVTGFERKVSASVPLSATLRAFTTPQHEHLVAVSGGSHGEASLLQASFKGSWEASQWASRKAVP